MRATKRFERRITTPYYKVGELKEVFGCGTVLLESSSGVPFEYIKIKGVTKQEPPNLAEKYFSQIKNAQSYMPAGVTGTYYWALPSEFVGKQLTYQLEKAGDLGGVSLYLSDGENAFFSNLTPLCDSSGTTYKVSGDSFTHLIFQNVYTSDMEDEYGDIDIVYQGIIDFWQACDISVTAEISPEFEAPVLCVGDKGARINLFIGSSRKTVIIPQAMVNQGTTIPMLFSEYDEIEIRGREKRVIYREGSAKIQLTGNEAWTVHTPTAIAGHGIFAYYYAPTAFYGGYCPSLKYAPWMPQASRKNIFTKIGTRNLAIKLERTESSSEYYKPILNEITSFLKERNSAGESVTLTVKRGTAIEHDISKTQIAEALLSILLPYGKDGEIFVTGYELLPNVEIGYYSLNEGDSSILTVISQNESGKEILSSVKHTLRKGSIYKLSAPEIEGYAPVQAELWGALREDKTVIIKYKEI